MSFAGGFFVCRQTGSEMKRKTIAQFEVVEKTKDGGKITISTDAIDRDRDRVMPSGAQIDNYLKNPVVQWGHNYADPWATIGKTTQLVIGKSGIDAEFELREPVNDEDPQNVIRALWDGGLIRTASIGFNPIDAEENEAGGLDFTNWELLEWSLVPIPANQEALRLAVKSFSDTDSTTITPVEAWNEGERVSNTKDADTVEVEVVTEDAPAEDVEILIDTTEPKPKEEQPAADDQLLDTLLPQLEQFLISIREAIENE